MPTITLYAQTLRGAGEPCHLVLFVACLTFWGGDKDGTVEAWRRPRPAWNPSLYFVDPQPRSLVLLSPSLPQPPACCPGGHFTFPDLPPHFPCLVITRRPDTCFLVCLCPWHFHYSSQLNSSDPSSHCTPLPSCELPPQIPMGREDRFISLLCRFPPLPRLLPSLGQNPVITPVRFPTYLPHLTPSCFPPAIPSCVIPFWEVVTLPVPTHTVDF